MKRHSLRSGPAGRSIGVASLLGFVAFALGSNANTLTRFDSMNAAKAEDKVTGGLRSGKLAPRTSLGQRFDYSFGDEGAMPKLEGAIGWLNSVPLKTKELRGKVVLINFWTYTCINSIRPLPYLRYWVAKYKDAGLVVIGVHTPEFSFEHERVNVENATRTLNITFPVTIDSNYRIWRSFNNEAWPAQYLVDAKGRIRYHHFGEGNYGEIERMIQQLLKENGATGLASDTTSVSGVGIEAAPDWADVHSPETYVGYRQAQNFASLEKVQKDPSQVPVVECYTCARPDPLP